MDREQVIDRLKRNQASLRSMGLAHISLFGSTARGVQSAASDVDLAVKFDESAAIDLFRFAAISERLRRLLGVKVDMVVEPARNSRIQAEIDRDRMRVF